MGLLLCALMGYLVGTLNPAYLLGKRKGVDIRQKGSGNAGATNALLLFGKLTGVFCALFDIAKTFAVIRLASWMFPDRELAFAVTAVCCILGHIFPFYMQFKGGKGLACLGGMILAHDWMVLAVMLAVEIIIVLVTDYLCIVPITASVIFPVVYGVMTRNRLGTLLLYIPAAVIIWRHLENLKRICKGTELHFSYLWKPEQEMKRLQENADATDDAMEERFGFR